jgi:hypothetical protein
MTPLISTKMSLIERIGGWMSIKVSARDYGVPYSFRQGYWLQQQ